MGITANIAIHKPFFVHLQEGEEPWNNLTKIKKNINFKMKSSAKKFKKNPQKIHKSKTNLLGVLSWSVNVVTSGNDDWKLPAHVQKGTTGEG